MDNAHAFSFFFFQNFFLFKHHNSLPFHTLQFHISSISLQLFSLIDSKMNPDDYDLSTSDGCRRALTRALFDVVNEAKAECLAQMQREQAAAAAVEARVPRPIRRRTFVPREHDVAHERLFADYFAENPRWGPNVFHRRFRMSRDLFLRIVHTLEGRDEYFQYREDGIGRPGLTPLQKCTVAIRQLAYGTTTDMFDEYLHVGETTGRECLKTFL